MGCFHPARNTPVGRVVLLFSPIGYEHVRCHRSYWRLADQLARRGLSVLRFDALGMGDSALESDEVLLDDWIDSVVQAAGHARELSGCEAVDFVGLRLSATLGVLASPRNGCEFRHLVLWEPVLDGREHVSELFAEHVKLASELGHGGEQVGQDPVGILGYPLRRRLLAQVEEVTVDTYRGLRAREVSLVDNSDDGRLAELRARLEAAGLRAAHAHVPETGIWKAEPYKQYMPHASIRAIAERLTGGAQ
jgi:hypothetical protein